MKEKVPFSFFDYISALIWAFFITVVFFAFFLLFFGQTRAPSFFAGSAALTLASPDDPALEGKDGSAGRWYVLTAGVRAAGDNLSPFSYSAKDFELISKNGEEPPFEYFIVSDGADDFSKASPEDFDIKLYINSEKSEEEIAEELAGTGFKPGSVVRRFGFLKKKVKTETPGFYLSENDIICNTAF